MSPLRHCKILPLARSNEAVTIVSEFITTSHGPVPLQDPPHPRNTPRLARFTDNETTVPGVNASVQSPPQVIPAGVLSTVPPAPLTCTVKVTGAGTGQPLLDDGPGVVGHKSVLSATPSPSVSNG